MWGFFQTNYLFFNDSSVKKGDVLSLQIEKLAYKGIGIAYVDMPDIQIKEQKSRFEEAPDMILAKKIAKGKFIIFVPNTLPGETCEVRIIKLKKNYAEAKKIATVTASPLVQAAPCPYFGTCGGCKWQNMSYEEQLKTKQQFIQESLQFIGRTDTPYELLPIVPSPEQYGYRNKIELSCGILPYLSNSAFDTLREEEAQRDEGFFLGYHGAGSFDKIVDIDACLLMGDIGNRIIQLTKAFVLKKKLTAYNPRTHEGFLRHVIVRHGVNTGELMLNIVTTSTDDYTGEFFQPLIDDLLMLENTDIKIESVLWTQNDALSDTSYSNNYQVVYGREYIFDRVGEFLFKISPYSFFQTNTKGAEKLYDLAKEFADLQGGESVMDLYAGTGTIGMYLAKAAKKIISLESEASAVADAKVNATMNNILNIEFICGKVENEIARFMFEKPDVIVLDPPRAGMHPKALEFLPRFAAKKIIYVSCNPTTLARDLAFLQKWYVIKRVQGVDMFPQTYHVETVVELVRK